MAIDFSVQLPCAVRKSIPEAKLRTMVSHWGLAEFAIGKLKQTYPQHDMAKIVQYSVEIGVRTPQGTTKQTPVTIAQILTMIAPLQEVKAHCEGCPANVSERSFGCIGKVNYPIKNEAEQWLLARLPDDAKGPDLSLLLQFISDMEIDGAPVDSRRTNPHMFESKTPALRKWGGLFNKKQISSSQIIHMLAFGGSISAQQAALYTKLLTLHSIQSEPSASSNAVEQFKMFMHGIAVAGALKAYVFVDS